MSFENGYENRGTYKPDENRQSSNNNNFNNTNTSNNNNGNYSGNNSGGGNSNNYSSNNNGGNSYSNNNWKNKKQWKGGNNSWKKKEEEPFDPSKVELYLPYAVTGNKEAPPEIVDRIQNAMRKLEYHGYTSRTGGMEGLDNVIEKTVNRTELVIPWKGFSDKYSKNYYNTKESLVIARMFHSSFDGLKPAIQAFLAKNVRQILGKDLKSAVMFLICWTEDAVEDAKYKTVKTGNMGHVISIATARRIPIFNFQNLDAEERLYRFLGLEDGETQVQNQNNQQNNQPTGPNNGYNYQ